MPKISVIVPVYQAEKYLSRCIDSILAQTERNIEIILVNDGSSDGSGVICEEYAQRDGRVRVIHQPNRGASAARNQGIEQARGEYLMFCDSDDYVSCDWCRSLLDAITTHPKAFVASNMWRVENDTVTTYRPESDQIASTDYFTLYKNNFSAYSCNKIYRADVINQHRLRFDETRFLAEDVVFNVEYASACNYCIYVGKPLYYYVSTQGSIMNSYHANLLELHLPLFWRRLPLIAPEYLGEYCDIWLYQFLCMFDNVFDGRNSMHFFQKLQFNQRMIQTKEFDYCLEHATGKHESAKVMQLLRTKNYYYLWFVSRLSKLKSRLTVR